MIDCLWWLGLDDERVVMRGEANEEKYKSQIVTVVRKYVPHGKIYLFGSRARRTNWHESDIDLALDVGKELDFMIIARIKEDLENTTIPFTFDIVDVHEVGTEMRESIEKEKVLWSE